MISEVDEVLVAEEPLWPAYHLPPELPPSPPDQPVGCWERLRRWLTGRGTLLPGADDEGGPDVEARTEGTVSVVLPPPPSVYGVATLFEDDPEANERSREALAAYRAEYKELDEFPYPLRLRRGRHAGLPVFLTGYLEEARLPDIPEDPEGVAADWLFQNLRAGALFGTDPDEARQRLRTARVVRFRRGDDPADLSIKVRYQQWQAEWPVFGGRADVHLTTGDPRAAVTSSYFPLPADLPLSPQIDEAQAISLARQALSGYFEGAGAAGLYWGVLRPWLNGSKATDVSGASWGSVETRVAEKQLYALAEFSRGYDHIFPEIERVVESGQLPSTQDELLGLLRPAAETWQQIQPGPWQEKVVPVAGSLLFVLPFAGRYYLAYQVEFLSPGGDQAWRVFVDAGTGLILGRPESRLVNVLVHYPTAADVLAGNNPEPIPMSGAQLEAAIGDFMALKWHPEQGGGAVDLVAIEGKSSGATTQIDREAANVAFHAHKMYRYFIDTCGADPADFGGAGAPGLDVAVGQVGPALPNGTHQLVMGFNPAASLPRPLITFQTDGGPGLTADDDGTDRLVFKPGDDPEVVYHELSHGLMYQVNDDPFDQQNASVPFGRALVEGYANYYARSVAAALDSGSDLWGRAAYRQSVWGEMWSLDRSQQVPGEDLLAPPNLYPHNKVEGTPVYRLGMVLARALWKVRKLLGPALADRLAFRAYDYLPGWLVNFELAAEGLINEARLEAGVSDEQVQEIINIFSWHGILAERGVQALARAGGGPSFAGTDAGLKISDATGQNWGGWVDLGQGSGAKGVVALAADDPNNAIYAVTEDAVYRRDLGQGGNLGDPTTWDLVGSWPAGQTPLCLMVVGGAPYVGSGHGVWEFPAGGDWQQWGDDPGATDLNGLAWQMADMQPLGGAAQNRYAQMIAGVMSRRYGNPAYVWQNPGQPGQRPVIALAARNNTMYAGTMKGEEDGTIKGGIWRQVRHLDDSGAVVLDPWTEFVGPGSIGNASVLCLAVDGAQLLAGTSSGLYQIDANGGATLLSGGGFPANAVVTALLPAGSFLLIGTASDGLWRKEGLSWAQIPGIGP
ncbi:MAG: hypothetical protein ACE5H9_09945 [Anaerolineae bacterium]